MYDAYEVHSAVKFQISNIKSQIFFFGSVQIFNFRVFGKILWSQIFILNLISVRVSCRVIVRVTID